MKIESINETASAEVLRFEIEELKRSRVNEQEESYMEHVVRCEVESNEKRVAEVRSRWFNSYALPKASVLARLPRLDRDALIAHFRAKELRKIADATHEGNHYFAGLARKRLDRVNEMASAFAEVTGCAA